MVLLSALICVPIIVVGVTFGSPAIRGLLDCRQQDLLQVVFLPQHKELPSRQEVGCPRHKRLQWLLLFQLRNYYKIYNLLNTSL